VFLPVHKRRKGLKMTSESQQPWMTGPLPEHSIYPTAEISPNSLDGRTGICLVFIYIYICQVCSFLRCVSVGPHQP
jgi:hypothetical protein